jgi:hypothetical protein
MRCGRTEGRRNVRVATNFYTPILLTFQPVVWDEGIRSGAGQWFGDELPGELDIFKWQPRSSRIG